jgi:AraC-like DNA-binding protein
MPSRYPIQSFVENSPLIGPAVQLERIWSAAKVGVSGFELSTVKVKRSAVGEWWLCSIEGCGLTRVDGELQAVTPPDYVLLTLTLNGQFQTQSRSSLLRETNTISLGKWSELDPIISWGSFGYLIFYIPRADIKEIFGDGARPYCRSIGAGIGAGAVLSACLRAFANEVFRNAPTSAMASLQPEIIRLALQAFKSGVAPDHLVRRSAMDCVLSYVEDHLTDPDLSPKAVAAACGLSERQFYRTFEQRGEKFGSLLRRLRLERAAHCLRNNRDASITEIAYECGFKTLSHFGQAFRQMFGTSPYGYRFQTRQ